MKNNVTQLHMLINKYNSEDVQKGKSLNINENYKQKELKKTIKQTKKQKLKHLLKKFLIC